RAEGGTGAVDVVDMGPRAAVEVHERDMVVPDAPRSGAAHRRAKGRAREGVCPVEEGAEVVVVPVLHVERVDAGGVAVDGHDVVRVLVGMDVAQVVGRRADVDGLVAAAQVDRHGGAGILPSTLTVLSPEPGLTTIRLMSGLMPVRKSPDWRGRSKT